MKLHYKDHMQHPSSFHSDYNISVIDINISIASGYNYLHVHRYFILQSEHFAQLKSIRPLILFL